MGRHTLAIWHTQCCSLTDSSSCVRFSCILVSVASLNPYPLYGRQVKYSEYRITVNRLTGFVPSFWTMDGLYWHSKWMRQKRTRAWLLLWLDTFVRKSGKAMLDPLDQRYGYSWETASSNSLPMLKLIASLSKNQRNNAFGWRRTWKVRRANWQGLTANSKFRHNTVTCHWMIQSPE